MSVNATAYVLSDVSGVIWGVYNSDMFLRSVCKMICDLKPDSDLLLQEFYINTNEVKTRYRWDTLKNNKIKIEDEDKNKCMVDKDPDQNKCISLTTNSIILKEVKKIEAMYEKFLNFKTSLEKVSGKNSHTYVIPSFLETPKKIFDAMIEKTIPEDEQFSYFLDTYYHYNNN